MNDVKKLRSYSSAGVDVLNRAVRLLAENNGDIPATIAALRKVPLATLGHAIWNEAERKQLSDGAAQYHNDIAEIAKHIKTKKMSDVVKKYYISIGYVLLIRVSSPLFPIADDPDSFFNLVTTYKKTNFNNLKNVLQ